jgi:1,4-dihydroxy-2-naphthoate octaprenyltransferase
VDTAYLISVGGAVMALITAASIICAYCYMGGPKPLAYTPFSELCVFLFFGLTAVCGTFYLQTGKVTIACAVMACAMGMIATAVLVVNNYRDIAHDASIGRRTLAVLMGERRTEALYEALLTGPFILIAALAIGLKAPAFIIVAAALPQARKLIRTLPEKRAYELNPVLFATVKLELLFSALTTLGAVLHWLIAK